MKKVTIKYGQKQREVTVSTNATVGTILADTTNRVVLGYGDNVRALQSGVELSNDSVVADGAFITLETRANQKAS